MRATVLIRIGSFQAQSHLAIGSVIDKDSDAEASFLRRSLSIGLSPRSAGLHIDVNERREFPSHRLQRVRSKADLIGADRPSQILLRTLLLEKEVVEWKGRVLDFGGIWTSKAATAVPVEEEEEEEEVEYSGGGVGKGRKIGGGRAAVAEQTRAGTEGLATAIMRCSRPILRIHCSCGVLVYALSKTL